MSVRRVPVERLAIELLAHYAIETPPVPVEAMLQNPARDMWQEVDFALLGAQLNTPDPLALRMALACLLAQHLLNSPWGQAHGANQAAPPLEDVRQLARAVLMPRPMLSALPAAALEPAALGRMFEVPRDEARRRLIELDVVTG